MRRLRNDKLNSDKHEQQLSLRKSYVLHYIIFVTACA